MYEFFEHISGDSKVLEVRKNGAEVVSISYYFNSFHNFNVYFNVNEISMLDKINRELLYELCSYFGKPVQIMISSKYKEITDKLKILGFERKRACYEVDVSKGDYCGYDDFERNLTYADRKSKEFELCADIMLKRYIDAHREINAWTGDEKDFFNILPEKVIYEKDGDEIENLAFIDDEEIAYVCGKNIDSFRRFSGRLVLHLFEKYESIFFEADDNDDFAIELKKLFNKDYGVTWDTYIYSA